MDTWQEIEQVLDEEFAIKIKSWFHNKETSIYTFEEIVKECASESKDVQIAVDIMVDDGLLLKITAFKCPYCQGDVRPEDSENDLKCPHCKAELEEGVETLEEYFKYKIQKPRTRDVKWVITIHGMNTHGPWQEDFSWRLDQMYGYSIPISLFKYGNIKLRALLDLSQKKYVKIFAQEIRKLSKEINSGKPDVIAHSYGTLLLSEVLKMDENADIKLGRIILAGSIVRPDYDWNKVITNGQVEAVMCHYSPKDFPVKMSHYTIPSSGPSGCVGFNDRESVVHSREETYGHSDYFLEKNIDHVMSDVWSPFLTKNIIDLKSLNNNSTEICWTASKFRYLTHFVKLLLILAIVIIVIVATVSIWLGFSDTWVLMSLWVKSLWSDSIDYLLKQAESYSNYWNVRWG